jgi:RNA polymerase sigma-54 factor
MKLTASQVVSQKQSIVITAQLQQAIKLLQMNNFELSAYLETQSLENPFLDVDASGQHGDEAPAEDQPNASADPEIQSADLETGTSAADTPLTTEAMDNTFDSNLLDLGSGGAQPAGGQDWDLIASTISEQTPSLYAHICAEIDALLTQPRERMIGYAMAEAIEPSGWLGQSVAQLSKALQVPPEAIETVLTKLQTIEPAGLFARSLAECLMLQAKASDSYGPEMQALLDHLDLLASGDMKALAKACAISPERLRALVRMLRSFNPKPGTLFEQGGEPIRAPDLIVTKTNEGWAVDLNRSTMPSVQINRGLAQVAMTAGTSEQDRKFLSERIADAKWLRRAIEQRNSTTLAIGAEIVRRQQAFLDQGIGALKPLVLRDVAEAVKVHESTVSRVTSGLMIATPQGSFRLKAMFSVGLQNDDEDGAEAASAIKYKIKKLIETEPPSAPYSDDKIVSFMAKEGVKLARRTVAKYRDMQKIPSSFQRRRQAALAGHV